MKAIIDIETDSLNATKIHCIVSKDYDTGEIKTWVLDECENFPKWSQKIDQFIMHNGVSFDAPILNRILNCNIKVSQVRDTLIESQLFNPIREGGHSLEAWGKRLNYNKGDFNEFESYSKDMLEYCIRDTELTWRVAHQLEKEGKDFSEKSIRLEHNIRTIIDQQQRNGFAFKIREATVLLAQLEEEERKLEAKAQEIFPPTEVQLKTKVKYIPFNIASRKQIAERLQQKGWEPKQYTEKGNVIVNEKILNEIDMPEAQMFSRFFLLQKRTGLLKAWIKECEEDERVRGKVLTLKTITGRMAHHSPNMAQVPAVYSPYGKECRDLWTIGDANKYSLVGTDASGLELRCLAHYMGNKKYIEEVLDGDIHTANMKLAGLTDRDQAKTFIYAFLYGAGAAKIGKIVGGDAQKGQKLVNTFLDNLPDLKKLRTKIQQEAESGKIKGLDGRYLKIRSEHAALNTLLQGAGAIVCKKWLIHIIKKINMSGIDAKLVASIHDEYQFEVLNKDVNRFCTITKEAIDLTTRTLNMKCKLDCDYKVGKTWAMTH
jgi:DNA polymerase-1